MTELCRYVEQTHIFVRPMWEHRRLVVVHAFISKVVIDYLDELYKFLSSTKHAFCHLEREKSRAAVKDVSDGKEGKRKRNALTQIYFHYDLFISDCNTLVTVRKLLLQISPLNYLNVTL